jgi:hypothetical protein
MMTMKNNSTSEKQLRKLRKEKLKIKKLLLQDSIQYSDILKLWKDKKNKIFRMMLNEAILSMSVVDAADACVWPDASKRRDRYAGNG